MFKKLSKNRSLSRSRSKRKRRIIIACCVIFLLWIVGFFAFYTFSIPHNKSQEKNLKSQYANITHTDAIVVLTGGMGRINFGFNLLKKNLSSKMLISGVYRANTVKTILRYNKDYPKDALQRISLGYDARNTHGNAIEAKKWMDKNHFTSLRLVTAYYHMPRALMFFKNVMPNIKIATTPVYLHNKIKGFRVVELLFIEYTKYSFWKVYFTLSNLL